MHRNLFFRNPYRQLWCRLTRGNPRVRGADRAEIRFPKLRVGGIKKGEGRFGLFVYFHWKSVVYRVGEGSLRRGAQLLTALDSFQNDRGWSKRANSRSGLICGRLRQCRTISSIRRWGSRRLGCCRYWQRLEDGMLEIEGGFKGCEGDTMVGRGERGGGSAYVVDEAGFDVAGRDEDSSQEAGGVVVY